jgi:hypothetical protein
MNFSDEKDNIHLGLLIVFEKKVINFLMGYLYYPQG